MLMIADAVRWTLFPAMMAFAASSDLFTMTISNRVSLILLGGFFALAGIADISAIVMLSHLGTGCVVLAAAFGLFARGIIGGGDAKLAAAAALWLGFDHLLPFLLLASLLGGALSVSLIWFRMAPLPEQLARYAWVERLHVKNGGVPYGIGLAAAALAIYPDTAWVRLAPLPFPGGSP